MSNTEQKWCEKCDGWTNPNLLNSNKCSKCRDGYKSNQPPPPPAVSAPNQQQQPAAAVPPPPQQQQWTNNASTNINSNNSGGGFSNQQTSIDPPGMSSTNGFSASTFNPWQPNQQSNSAQASASTAQANSFGGSTPTGQGMNYSAFGTAPTAQANKFGGSTPNGQQGVPSGSNSGGSRPVPNYGASFGPSSAGIFSPNLNITPVSTTKRKTPADRMKAIKERRNPTNRPNIDAVQHKQSAKKRRDKVQEVRNKPLNYVAITEQFKDYSTKEAEYKNVLDIKKCEIENIDEQMEALREKKRMHEADRDATKLQYSYYHNKVTVMKREYPFLRETKQPAKAVSSNVTVADDDTAMDDANKPEEKRIKVLALANKNSKDKRMELLEFIANADVMVLKEILMVGQFHGYEEFSKATLALVAKDLMDNIKILSKGRFQRNSRLRENIAWEGLLQCYLGDKFKSTLRKCFRFHTHGSQVNLSECTDITVFDGYNVRLKTTGNHQVLRERLAAVLFHDPRKIPGMEKHVADITAKMRAGLIPQIPALTTWTTVYWEDYNWL